MSKLGAIGWREPTVITASTAKGTLHPGTVVFHTQPGHSLHGRIAARAQLSIEPGQRSSTVLRLIIKIHCLVELKIAPGYLQHLGNGLGATVCHFKHRAVTGLFELCLKYLQGLEGKQVAFRGCDLLPLGVRIPFGFRHLALAGSGLICQASWRGGGAV